MTFRNKIRSKMFAVDAVYVGNVIVKCRPDIAGRGESYFPCLCAAAAFFSEYRCPTGITPVQVIFSEI